MMQKRVLLVFLASLIIFLAFSTISSIEAKLPEKIPDNPSNSTGNKSLEFATITSSKLNLNDATPVFVGEVNVKNLKKPTSNEI